jgi:hypothetical protein
MTLALQNKPQGPIRLGMTHYRPGNDEQFGPRRLQGDDILKANFRDHFVGSAPQGLNEHVFLRGKVPVEATRAACQAGCLLDVPDSGFVIATLGNQLNGRVKDSFPAWFGKHIFFSM